MTRPAARAILFDLDGTLVNSLEDIASAMNHILTEDGLPTHEVSAYRYFIGGGARHLVHSALPEERHGETSAILERFRNHYRNALVVRTAPYPGAPELLEALVARKVPMAILSNKPDDMTQALVERFFPDVPFLGVAGAIDGKPKKPDPVAAEPLLAKLGVAPPEVLMVGDTKTDMQTATATGMRGVGVTWGFRERAELEAHGAFAVIETPEALLDLV